VLVGGGGGGGGGGCARVWVGMWASCEKWDLQCNARRVERGGWRTSKEKSREQRKAAQRSKEECLGSLLMTRSTHKRKRILLIYIYIYYEAKGREEEANTCWPLPGFVSLSFSPQVQQGRLKSSSFLCGPTSSLPFPLCLTDAFPSPARWTPTS